MIKKFHNLLHRQTNPNSLAVFRISFGFIVALTVLEWIIPRANGKTSLQIFFTDPGILFPYPFFEWITPTSLPMLNAIAWTCIVASLCLALGMLTRIAATIVFLTWTYLFLLDQSQYNNHYYLQSLIAFVLIFSPSSSVWSLDALIRNRNAKPDASLPLIPFAPIFALRAQLTFVYVFGAVVKLNSDWLIHAQPVKIFLQNSTAAKISPLANSDVVAYFIAYTGVLFDFLIAPLLLIPRTRILAVFLLLAFHGINHFFLFTDIGYYPLLGILASTIFLEPNWPNRVHKFLKLKKFSQPNLKYLIAGFILLPPIGAALGWRAKSTASFQSPTKPSSPLMTAFILIFLILQTLIPLRHYLIPGDAAWSHEGDYFSWRMKASAKTAVYTAFMIDDPIAAKPLLEKSNPTTLFYNLHSQSADFKRLPTLFATVEPIIGSRLIYNPQSSLSQSDPIFFGSPYTAQSRIKRHWRNEFDSSPTFAVTTSRKQVFNTLLTKFSAFPDTTPQMIIYLKNILKLSELLSTPQTDLLKLKSITANLRNNLQALLQTIARKKLAKHQSLAIQHLAELPPLALTGSLPSNKNFLIIMDPKFKPSPDSLIPNPEKKRTKHAVIDLHVALTPDFLRLPQSLPTITYDKKLTFFYNHIHESDALAAPQIRVIGARPNITRLFARHIARQYHQIHARTPKIYVFTYVTLNQHPTQPLVDPAVDLAASPYHHLSHNPWILPHNPTYLPN